MNTEQIKSSLNEIMAAEIDALKELLSLMEEQHEYIVKNDVFNMESIVEKIKVSNQKVASLELKRREITKGFAKENSFSSIIRELKDIALEESYREIIKLLEELRLQKETNELLIKQSLSFVNNMLMLLNPDRQAKTYNGYGKITR